MRARSLIVLLALSASPALADQTFCRFAPSQVSWSAAVTGAGAATAVVVPGAQAALGVTVVAHSSGMAIATGSGGYIAGTIGAAGLLPAATLFGGAIVVGGLGMEAACAVERHPEALARSRDAVEAGWARSRQAASDAERSLRDVWARR